MKATKDELTKVKIGDFDYNYINKEGINEWFKLVGDFKDGLAVVQRTNGEQCKIDKNGKIVSKQTRQQIKIKIKIKQQQITTTKNQDYGKQENDIKRISRID